MTSMFDQSEASQGRPPAAVTVPTPLTSSGYVSVSLEPPSPIFSKQRMNFNPSDSITHVAVASDYLVLGMANNVLFRIDLKNPDRHEEITISKYIQPSMKLSGLFIDPLGCHVLLSFAGKAELGPELLYLHRKSSKPKPINKSKSYEVTAVGWNMENTSEATTGTILLGTSKGLILESEIGPDGDKMFQSSIEQYWRHVFDIGKNTNTPITGIEFFKVMNTHKYNIFVTTPERLYPFSGFANPEDKPLFQSIFNNYLNVPEAGFREVLSGLDYSMLQFFYEKTKKQPSLFGWLTGAGIFHRQLDPRNKDYKTADFLNGDNLHYPPMPYVTEDLTTQTPISFVLTEFHALILYPDCIKALCLLNRELVLVDEYNESLGKLIHIVKDPVKQTIWAVTDRAVFRYKVTREERNVWKIYADKNEFQLAKKYCGNNPAFIDKIKVKEAELLFEKGDFEKSAEIFADTQSNFEGICLKFLNANQVEALKLFLQRKLKTLKKEDQIQITMLVVWIIELYLSQISQAKLDNPKMYATLQMEFKTFLSASDVADCVKRNKSVIYDLMASHGDKENHMKLTIINKDYENVIRQNIYKKAYFDAITNLNVQSRKDLYYKFIPVLIQKIPKQAVNALIEQGKTLNPARLLPAMISCQMDEEHVKEIIRYLEFSVQVVGCTDSAMHNFLLSLYVNYDQPSLKGYLASQGQSAAMVHYDIHYALRLCQEKNLTEACVQLFSLLRLWEKAVQLALTINIDLAKSIADMPDDIELKKKLRLKIAQFVISGKEDIQQAMELLQECDLIKIEDILPFFSDFVTIDHFREPICNSLQEYNQQIQDLREEMEEATKSADQVRSEIQTFRNRCALINHTELCVLCDIALLLRPFYIFPCGHKFHSDCLSSEMQPLLGPAKKNKLAELQRQLTSHFPESAIGSREQLAHEVDAILASECLYCGEHMIQAIDTPFIPDADWERVMKEWE